MQYLPALRSSGREKVGGVMRRSRIIRRNVSRDIGVNYKEISPPGIYDKISRFLPSLFSPTRSGAVYFEWTGKEKGVVCVCACGTEIGSEATRKVINWKAKSGQEGSERARGREEGRNAREIAPILWLMSLLHEEWESKDASRSGNLWPRNARCTVQAVGQSKLSDAFVSVFVRFCRAAPSFEGRLSLSSVYGILGGCD